MRVDVALDVVNELDLKLNRARIIRERRRVAAVTAKTSNCERRDDDNNNDDGVERKEVDEDENNNDYFDLSQSHTAAQVEVDRLVSQLMHRTIIAHGSMSQLVLEAMGVAQKYNFGTVVNSS